MSEYWKSTPSYWCKFCSQYVRDTGIERKNHEASAKHQNNIQRSLRDLHKNKERQERETQRAKDEVARLNGMFDGKPKSSALQSSAAPGSKSTPPAPALNAVAERKARAEQLAALGVALPEELKKEVTGVGSYHTISEREVEASTSGAVVVNRSLAEILAESRKDTETGKEAADADSNEEGDSAMVDQSRKRKADDENDIRDEEMTSKRKAWGSHLKTYPGEQDPAGDVADLDKLLSEVSNRVESSAKLERNGDVDAVKKEEFDEQGEPLENIPDNSNSPAAPIKEEDDAAVSITPVVFKKRKVKAK